MRQWIVFIVCLQCVFMGNDTSSAAAVMGSLHGMLQLSVSHTDFSSILQGTKFSWFLEQEAVCLQIFRAKTASQSGDTTWPRYIYYTHFNMYRVSLLTGRRFSPGYTPHWRDTMAVKPFSVCKYSAVFTVYHIHILYVFLSFVFFCVGSDIIWILTGM